MGCLAASAARAPALAALAAKPQVGCAMRWGMPLLLVLAAAAPPPAPTTVVAIYPSAKELPENVLKFYLHFSAPMGRRGALRTPPPARRPRQARPGPVFGPRRGTLDPGPAPLHPAVRPRPDQARTGAARGAGTAARRRPRLHARG